MVRAVCVLALAGVMSTVGRGRAVAGGGEQLFQRRPDRLLIESSQRVSDGRKIQRDADQSFRRAEGGAEGEENGAAAADRGSEGSRAGASTEESAARARTGADRE